MNGQRNCMEASMAGKLSNPNHFITYLSTPALVGVTSTPPDGNSKASGGKLSNPNHIPSIVAFEAVRAKASGGELRCSRELSLGSDSHPNAFAQPSSSGDADPRPT